MDPRTNEEWLRALKTLSSDEDFRAFARLHHYLSNAVQAYLSTHRSEVQEWPASRLASFVNDMVQESMAKVLANLDSFQGKAKFTTWAYSIAINRTASELRRRCYQDISLEQLVEETSGTLRALILEGGDPQRLAEQAEYRALLYRIIQEALTERQRVALVGVYLQGYSMEEMALALGTNRNALYKLLHDARKRLKRALEENYLSPGDLLSTFQE